MKNEQYVLVKKSSKKDIIYIDYKSLIGFKVKPKNSKKYGMNVNEMLIIKPYFIDTILKRKVGKRLESYINYLIEILDDDDADGAKLAQTLDDIERYRMTIKNNYQNYLNERYVEILLKKLSLVEEKLKEKMDIFYIRIQKQIEEKIKNEQKLQHKMIDEFDINEKKSRKSR